MSSGQRTARRNAWTAVLEDRRRAKDRVEAQHVLEAVADPHVPSRPRKLRGMARKETAADAAANPGRLKQIALTYKMTRKADPKIGLVLAAVGIVTFGVFLAIGFLIDHPIYLGILGFLLAFLAMAIVFGRRAERAAFGQMEGQPGAAAAVLDNVGRGWTHDPRGGDEPQPGRGAPGGRQGRHRAGRRGQPEPGEEPAGGREEEDGPHRGGRAGARHHRRRRRGPGAAEEAAHDAC